MRKFLTAAMVALIAFPAFAQTPATPARPATPAPAATAKPATAPATAPAPAAAPAAAGGKVDINAATEAQLDALPGIGEVRGKAIIAGRPYTTLNDLVKKKVLTKGVFDGAKSRMALANINTSSASDMAATLPGVGDVRSKAIVSGRPYASPQDLVTKGILTQPVLDKVKDLVAF